MNSLLHPVPTQLVFRSDLSARAFRKRQCLHCGVHIWSASSASAKQNVKTKPKSLAQVKVSTICLRLPSWDHSCSNTNTHSSGLTGCPHKRLQAASVPGDWQAHREPVYQVLQVSLYAHSILFCTLLSCSYIHHAYMTEPCSHCVYQLACFLHPFSCPDTTALAGYLILPVSYGEFSCTRPSLRGFSTHSIALSS